jgi:predicted transcriptional regulator
VEAEEAVLGSVLIDPAVLSDVARLLSPSDFFIVKDGWVFDAYLELAMAGQPIDFLTLCDGLGKRGQLAEIGGEAFISHLMNVTPTAIHAEGYAQIVKRASVRRMGLGLASDLARRMYEEGEDPLMNFDHFVAEAQHIRTSEAGRMGAAIPLVSASDILRAEYPEPFCPVEGLLTAGLWFCSGKAKMGKSWLMLQMACAVAAGGVAFGKRVAQGPVLYLALEDSMGRLKKRMNKQMWPAGLPIDFITGKDFRERVGNLAGEGWQRISNLIAARGYRMVIVDTVNKAILMYMKAGEQYDLNAMTRALAGIQESASVHNCVVVMVAHQPKRVTLGGGHDPVEDILGSVGFGATADGAWGLYRERGQRVGTLEVTGRDLEEESVLAVEFDKAIGTWVCVGNQGDLVITQRRKEILEALDGTGQATLKEISEFVGQPDSNTCTRINELVNEGLVRKILSGKKQVYELTDDGRVRLGRL